MLDRTEYNQTMIGNHDSVYIDTSTLMNVGSLMAFLEKFSGTLKSQGKKIIVTDYVRGELCRLASSDDERKRRDALEALNLLEENRDIFRFSNKTLPDQYIAEIFADAQFLAELILERSDHKQLLISNDIRLTADAYGLNKLRSIRGKNIDVCFLGRFGDLMTCACTAEEKTHEKEATAMPVCEVPEKKPETVFGWGKIAAVFIGGAAAGSLGTALWCKRSRFTGLLHKSA